MKRINGIHDIYAPLYFVSICLRIHIVSL